MLSFLTVQAYKEEPVFQRSCLAGAQDGLERWACEHNFLTALAGKGILTEALAFVGFLIIAVCLIFLLKKHS